MDRPWSVSPPVLPTPPAQLPENVTPQDAAASSGPVLPEATPDDEEDDFLVYHTLKEAPRTDHEWRLHYGLEEILQSQQENLDSAPAYFLPTAVRRDSAADDGIEIEFPPSMARFIDVPALQPDEVWVYKSSAKKTTAKPSGVIEKNYDALTPEDMRKHWALVETALRKEILAFHEFKTFVRALRSKSVNVCTSRWVLRWKEVDGKRVVKARLTIRGFQDLATELSTYASTATRWSQRIVASVASQHAWQLFTADVGSAFLRGMTFKEIADMTGEPEREVSFSPPAGSEKYFKELPGMSDFCGVKEVLKLLKPAYGLKDAPKAWRTRLNLALVALGGRALPTDSSLYTFHDSADNLTMILSCHVDDLKGAGTPKAYAHLIQGLEKQFWEAHYRDWHVLALWSSLYPNS